jgi:hypothetical protein
MLHRIHEAPFDCIHKNLPSKQECYHGRSTVKHYVVAKGQDRDVSMDVVRLT